MDVPTGRVGGRSCLMTNRSREVRFEKRRARSGRELRLISVRVRDLRLRADGQVANKERSFRLKVGSCAR